MRYDTSYIDVMIRQNSFFDNEQNNSNRHNTIRRMDNHWWTKAVRSINIYLLNYDVKFCPTFGNVCGVNIHVYELELTLL